MHNYACLVHKYACKQNKQNRLCAPAPVFRQDAPTLCYVFISCKPPRMQSTLLTACSCSLAMDSALVCLPLPCFVHLCALTCALLQYLAICGALRPMGRPAMHPCLAASSWLSSISVLVYFILDGSQVACNHWLAAPLTSQSCNLRPMQRFNIATLHADADAHWYWCSFNVLLPELGKMLQTALHLQGCRVLCHTGGCKRVNLVVLLACTSQ